VIEDIADQTNLLALNAAIELPGPGNTAGICRRRRRGAQTRREDHEGDPRDLPDDHCYPIREPGSHRGMNRVSRCTQGHRSSGRRLVSHSVVSKVGVVQASDQTQQIASATAQMATTIRERR